MRVRRLTTDAGLRTYADRFALTIRERSGGALTSTVPIEYLQRCTVRGIFDERGEMIGGYAVGTTLPLRLLEFVPATSSTRPPRGGSWSDCCEVVCMWRSRALPSARMSRVWPRVIADALMTGKRFILGHSEHARLDRLYARMGAETLYAGTSANGHPSRLLAYRRHTLVLRLATFLIVEAPSRLFRSDRSGDVEQR